MHDSPVTDPLDRQLVAALQIYPRASWVHLAPILVCSASTLSRRWATLVARGVAWSAAAIAPSGTAETGQLAFVEARCAAGQREESITVLTAIPEVIGIDTCAGAHDLVLTISGSSILAIDRLVNDHIAAAPGITRTRTNYASGIMTEGSSYRLRDLSQAQRAAVTALRPAPATPSQIGPTRAQARIAACLAVNARQPAADLARLAGLSISHARRLIGQLDAQPWFRARTDISVFDFGLVAAYLWVECPVEHIDSLARFLQRSPGLRMLVPIISQTNLLLSVWVPGLDQIAEIERRLAHTFPSATITDRWLQTSARKRLGIRLTPEGRAIPHTSQSNS